MKQIGGILILTLLLFDAANAQKKVSFSGYVKDASTGEDMIGANVFIREMRN